MPPKKNIPSNSAKSINIIEPKPNSQSSINNNNEIETDDETINHTETLDDDVILYDEIGRAHV